MTCSASPAVPEVLVPAPWNAKVTISSKQKHDHMYINCFGFFSRYVFVKYFKLKVQKIRNTHKKMDNIINLWKLTEALIPWISSATTVKQTKCNTKGCELLNTFYR